MVLEGLSVGGAFVAVYEEPYVAGVFLWCVDGCYGFDA